MIPKCFTLQRGEYDARIRKGNEVVVADALNDIYGTKILPLEKHYNYEVSGSRLECSQFSCVSHGRVKDRCARSDNEAADLLRGSENV